MGALGEQQFMTDAPKRIDPDAILECVFELQFTQSELPEVFLGRILSLPFFADFVPSRLPLADMPYTAQQAQPQFRHSPTYQLDSELGLFRVGVGVISFHKLAPYKGWGPFQETAERLVIEVWEKSGSPPLERCGLRYINALTASDHNVSSIDDLNLDVSIGSKKLLDVAVNFQAEESPDTDAIVRIASAKHVTGELPKDTSFAVDIDISTNSSISSWGSENIFEWLERAHKLKNDHFFELIPAPTIQELKAE